jgi:glyoxylase-like metal-dependent hydrolase (beta-lactamase superfamily II)
VVGPRGRTLGLRHPGRAALSAASTPSVVPGLELIDVMHLGRERVICCAAQDDVIVDPGPECSSRTLVDALGERIPRAILLTHIHLDHAGATGALVRRWPDVEVWVHQRGARHMIDPSALIESATRIYGDDMKRLWGEIVPVPERNLRVLEGGESAGDWDVVYTPGHAKHHVTYLHRPTRTAFCGDVAGVSIGENSPVLAPTPPPDIDLELWRESIARVRALDPAQLVATHFGLVRDPGPRFDELEANMTRFAELARTTTDAQFAKAVTDEITARCAPDAAASFLQAMPPDTLWAGLDRYWRRREEAAS